MLNHSTFTCFTVRFDTWAGVRRGWIRGVVTNGDLTAESPLEEEDEDEWTYADGNRFDHTTQYR